MLTFSLLSLSALSFVLFSGISPRHCLPVPWLTFLVVLWFFSIFWDYPSSLICFLWHPFLLDGFQVFSWLSDSVRGHCLPAPCIHFPPGTCIWVCFSCEGRFSDRSGLCLSSPSRTRHQKTGGCQLAGSGRWSGGDLAHATAPSSPTEPSPSSRFLPAEPLLPNVSHWAFMASSLRRFLAPRLPIFQPQSCVDFSYLLSSLLLCLVFLHQWPFFRLWFFFNCREERLIIKEKW